MPTAPAPEAIAQLTPALKHRLKWRLRARPNQLTPDGDWNTWLILSGRGWGKTEVGAQDMAKFGQEHPRSRLAIIAPTFGDARDTCVEGETGLLTALPPSAVTNWNRSLGELTLTNGTHYKLFSGAEPERLRGPQHHRIWFDEWAAFTYPQAAWDMAQFGLRLGVHPQVVVTTTPKGIKPIRDLRRREDAFVTVGSTFDNEANLPASTVAALRERYEGTRLGRQELYGEILDEVEGALWNMAMLDGKRVAKPPQKRWLNKETQDWEYADDMARVVIGVDPASTSGPDADHTGIVVVGRSAFDGRAYVLGDRTCRLSPDGWGHRVMQATLDYHADVVVLETNQGGEMAEQVINSAARAMRLPIPRLRKIHAKESKRLRAEPIAALYEQGRVSHAITASGMAADLSQLEDEMISFTPDSGFSPDRIDALVHALTELCLSTRPTLRFHA